MKVSTRYADAMKIAELLIESLGHWCHRIEIAGSLRRERPVVGDIEIVAVPMIDEALFGEGETRPLDRFLAQAVSQGSLEPIRGNRPMAKAATYRVRTTRGGVADGIQLDLYMTTPACWGVILALRTGPAEYSRRLVTERRKGGLLPDGYRVHQGRVYSDALEAPLETPEEEDFLKIAGGWIEPRVRL